MGDKRKNYYFIQKEIRMFRNLKNSPQLSGSEPSTSEPSINISSFQGSESEVSKDGGEIQINTPDVNLVAPQEESVCSIEDSDIVNSDCGDFSVNDSDVESETIESVRPDSEENVGITNPLADSLRNWYVKNNVTLSSFKDLLSILKLYHPELPLDPRSIFKNKVQQYEIKEFDSGQFVYFGLKKSLSHGIGFQLNSEKPVRLDINFDGCPIYKSTNTAIWPILCKATNSDEFIESKQNMSVFVAGIYYGSKKPPVHQYLEEFCTELNEICHSGLYIDFKHYNVKLRSIIADAPARAFIKQTRCHGGYMACDRCEVNGVYKDGSMSYEDFEAMKRTHENFLTQKQEGHHIGVSPLVNVQGIDMIHSFPIDYMHCAILGIMRRLMNIWLHKIPFKLSSNQKLDVNRNNALVKKYFPVDFNRMPRNLEETDRFKATEFRAILLYTGVIIFHKILDEKLYKHFLLLMFAVRIFCDSSMVSDQDSVAYAEKICLFFVKQYKKIYKMNIVYNLHCLTHIADDVRKYGVLDSISAFPFENMLGQMKTKIRSTRKPLQQLVGRYNEGFFSVNKNVTKSEDKCKINGHIIKPGTLKNVCVLLKNGDFGCISAVDGNLVEIEKFRDKIPSFDYPCCSSLIDMYIVQKRSQKIMISMNDIKCKCFVCPFQKGMIIMPLLQ